MKDNRLTKMLAIGAACALAASAAMAQTTTSVGANVGPVGVGLTTSSGAFAAAPANDYFTFRTGTVRPDMPATVHYVRTGDRMIVKRVVLAKPVTVTKETTTTTTTQP